MITNDDIILEILQGNKVENRWPKARLVKIFVATTGLDFVEERKQLLENIGPDLQSAFDEKQIEIELVDINYGKNELETNDVHFFEDQLNEIQKCFETSKSCFFMCLIGNKYKPNVLPKKIQKELFEVLEKKFQENGEENILKRHYHLNQNQPVYEFVPTFLSIKDKDKYDHMKLLKLLETTIEQLAVQQSEHTQQLNQLLISTIELQINNVLELVNNDTSNILFINRNFTNIPTSSEQLNETFFETNDFFNEKLSQLINLINKHSNDDNFIKFNVEWKSLDGIDLTIEEHENYIKQFDDTVKDKLKLLINQSLKQSPDLISKKKIVQEIFEENVTHLTLCFKQYSIDATTQTNTDSLLEKLEKIVKDVYKSEQKHGPLIIHGYNGAGKTTLIKKIYNESPKWFPQSEKIIRVVRFIGSTPRSAYGLELLRVICQQICIMLKLPDGFLPKDASFDPLYINNWFQTLLKRFDDEPMLKNYVFLILIDDIDKITPIDSDVVAALAWIPLQIPKNIFLLFTSGSGLDSLNLTSVQKDKFRKNDILYPLVNDQVIQQDSTLTIAQQNALVKQHYYDKTESDFLQLETLFGVESVSQFASLITCSQYGLSELELLEVLMPTGDIDGDILLSNANFNFFTFSVIQSRFKHLLYEKLMSGKWLIVWKHWSIKEYCKKHYLSNQETVRSLHLQIANLYFSEFEKNDENSNSTNEQKEKDNTEQQNQPEVVDIGDSTPFHSTLLHSDVSYSLRHVEESWIHLLKAGDSHKLKTYTVCNFDFLLAAIQTVSVSYLRCILEHVRCYLLDRDLELVYYTVRKCSDVLTRDPLQLGPQIISWLKPSADAQSEILSLLLTQAMAWCDGFNLPLLVPLTSWLTSPLGICVVGRGLQVNGVYQCVVAPSGQHVVCISEKNQPMADQPTLWHVMSKQLVHTFKGHSGPVLCMHITKQSQYLITGSEDISIIVWDLKTLAIKLKISEHIAPVLSITSALNNSIIISGSEDSSIILTSLSDGKLIMKIDHHRGPVTSVHVNLTGDILISASHDKTVCLWSLETFTLLNTIKLDSPIKMIDVSNDSVFLLAACEDNKLYLRTLATGTELHDLTGHKGKVRCLCIADDNCRAIVGCSDGRTYIYDMHSGHITRTITSGQNAEITCVRVTDKDDFLIVVGGNKVYFYPFRETNMIKPLLAKTYKRQSLHLLESNSSYITCVDICRDNQLAASGSSDNLVNVWNLMSQELLQTLDGHFASVTCVNFAPNGLFLASGSDDCTIKVWGVTLGSIVTDFRAHQSSICDVMVMLDSSRVLSADKDKILMIWSADDGTVLQTLSTPCEQFSVTNNMKYMVCLNGDNQLKIISMLKEDEKYSVCHSGVITCFVLTMDSLQVITGSKDMSLKVWQLAGGKLAQVLVSHTDAVTCVAISALNKNLVISGACDTNCIVWDVSTGADLHILQGHLAPVTCVKVSADGVCAVSGSEDKTIIVWDTKRGIQLTSLQLHLSILCVETTCDCSRITAILKDTKYLPIICLHNTTAKYIKLPTYCTPAKDVEARVLNKRQPRRLLKKEVSLDTYTWQKKYGHLTSNIMIAAVDERLKRRFSVSASMEEISKIPQQNKGFVSQAGQTSLAQSQHFDQLEALWNKRSPPTRRRPIQSLSKQSSLIESTLSSDEEEDGLDQLTELPRKQYS